MKSLPPIPDNRGPNDPSPSEIAERCAEIQAEWDVWTEARRRGKPRLSQVGRVRMWMEEPETSAVFDPGV